MEVSLYTSDAHLCHPNSKRRRIFLDAGIDCLACQDASGNGAFLPVLRSSDYFTVPCLSELAAREVIDPGYSSRVPSFTVGRYGFGSVKFLGKTDIRWLDLDKIFKLGRNEVVVHEDENAKPALGQGLNKAAEVTIKVQTRMPKEWLKSHVKRIMEKLRLLTERQGAQFLSFNSSNGEWKFLVQHFSRFGLNEDDEDDIIMDDASPEVQDPIKMNGGDISEFDDGSALMEPTLLSHSLPAHLGLDPVKMSEMKMLMFSAEEEQEDFSGWSSHQRQALGKESSISPLQHSSQVAIHKESPTVIRKTPLALLEYNPGNFGSNSPGSILLAKQEKNVLPRTPHTDGFSLDLKYDTPVTSSYSHNIVDAGLFMGRSFRVGWGPNGVLVHSGMPVSSSRGGSVLSSVVYLEKVAIDKVVRDENNKIREELVDLCFGSPLKLHKEMNHDSTEVEVGNFKLKLQKAVCNRFSLPEISRSYMEIVEKQLEVAGLSSVSRVLLMHQVMVWELIKVLFSERQMPRQLKSVEDDHEEDIMPDVRESSPDFDLEALPLIRRAEFSYWLQESVCHRVQNEVSSLDELSHLEHIFLLLTGRQLNAAVELAASRGDVRLACLLSQAGGSTVNRSDIGRQLEIWRVNGMDFNFIEKNRIRLLQLLSGDIQGSLLDVEIDWKRFLGLLMWYQLPPDTSLPVIFRTYQELLSAGKAPYPVPVYIDEGPKEEPVNWHVGQHCDLAYYLMLLHSHEELKFDYLKTMFSSFASTNDPLDCHAIWHQRAVLEAVGTFSANDLHVLDMGLVSQLLCLGQCHWAIYVVLHMPYREDYPYLHASVIREILFQYCEDWSTKDSQRLFIEDLGIPSAWLHEALATYFNYYGEFAKAMEHFLQCGYWQKAHSSFMTSVAHSLFLSAKHQEIWKLAVSMEDHKSEIEDWDLGAGIFLSFYLLKSSLQEDGDVMNELDTLDKKNGACLDFVNCLNKSLAIWGSKLLVGTRVVYSNMAEEICSLLLSDSGKDSTRGVQLGCFNTIFRAPITQDLQSAHLQDAVSLFTCYISETAS